jgi:hypothetical protein
MMAKQVKLDGEIRDQVTTTLAVGQETQHNSDIGKITRYSTHRQVVMEDIEKLKDVLEALWTGTVNIRQALFLSAKAGLQQVATFRPVGLSRALTALLSSMLPESV